MARAERRSSSARWLAVVLVAVLGVGVVILAALAYQRANPTIPADAANPVPTFTLGVQTATPTPTPTPTPEIPRDAERFLSVGSGAMWRATAGACGTVEPLLERSADGGESWSDVTPRYRGIAQIASLDAFAPTEAEMIVSSGAACDVQALRTFTQGRFWEPYADVLAASRYVDPVDPAVVHLGGGAIVAAPCDAAAGLRARADVLALVCAGTAYQWVNDGWAPLAGEGAAAVAISGTTVLVGHTDAACAGLAVTSFAAPDAPTPVTCVADVDPATPVAIAPSADGILVWSGDQLLTVGS